MEDPQGHKQKLIGNFSSQPYKQILNSPLIPKTLFMRQIKDQTQTFKVSTPAETTFPDQVNLVQVKNFFDQETS